MRSPRPHELDKVELSFILSRLTQADNPDVFTSTGEHEHTQCRAYEPGCAFAQLTIIFAVINFDNRMIPIESSGVGEVDFVGGDIGLSFLVVLFVNHRCPLRRL